MYVLSLSDVKKINYTFGKLQLIEKDLEFANSKFNDLQQYITTQNNINRTLIASNITYKSIVANQDTIINIQQVQLKNNKWNVVKYSSTAFVIGVLLTLILK